MPSSQPHQALSLGSIGEVKMAEPSALAMLLSNTSVEANDRFLHRQLAQTPGGHLVDFGAMRAALRPNDPRYSSRFSPFITPPPLRQQPPLTEEEEMEKFIGRVARSDLHQATSLYIEFRNVCRIADKRFRYLEGKGVRPPLSRMEMVQKFYLQKNRHHWHLLSRLVYVLSRVVIFFFYWPSWIMSRASDQLLHFFNRALQQLLDLLRPYVESVMMRAINEVVFMDVTLRRWIDDNYLGAVQLVTFVASYAWVFRGLRDEMLETLA